MLPVFIGVILASALFSALGLYFMSSRRAARWVSILASVFLAPVLLTGSVLVIVLGAEVPGSGSLALGFALIYSGAWLVVAAILSPIVFWLIGQLPVFSESQAAQ